MIHPDNEILAPANFLEKLRSETAHLHTSLEALPISKAIVSVDLTKEICADYLNLMQAVVRDTEQFVYPLLADVVPDIEQRRKLDWIENDLRALGSEIDQKPSGLQGDFTTAFALGIMYVVEGSSLGGRFILKNVTQVIGSETENATAFFSGYKEVTGSMWKNFLTALTQYETQHQKTDEIIAGVNFAFAAIHNQLSAKEQ